MSGRVTAALIGVVPVITAGLHCGTTAGAVKNGEAEVVPVITAGLHCGVS